jgi:CMP-N,N'-diacetyllegionaminic acid synthase
MYKKKSFLAVIIARKGSKGLKNKNILKLNRIPLVAYPIIAAKKSHFIDRVIVSTDSKVIKNIAKYYNADVPFIRPKQLSGDKISSRAVVLHAINFLKKNGESFDYVLLLEPTSPLTNFKDINKAIKILVNNESYADSLVSIGKSTSQHPIFQFEKNNKSILKKLFYKKINYLNRQELNDVYYLDGSLYISKIKKFIKIKDFLSNGRTIGLLLSKIKFFEIDDHLDFLIMKNLIKLNH